MNISIELVARSLTQVQSEALSVIQNFDRVTVLNIPDLTRFTVRSWEACGLLRNQFSEVIPHFRAIDFDLGGGRLQEVIEKNGLRSVLVVQGDPPVGLNSLTYHNTSCDVIRHLRKNIPDLTIYAGIDQYRGGVRQELDAIRLKKEAGADGFFSQPFFDLRLLDIYMDALADEVVYWGVSPVLSAASKSYWENKNNVVFPRDFELTLDFNADLAKSVLKRVETSDAHAYLMPIRADVGDYLRAVL